MPWKLGRKTSVVDYWSDSRYVAIKSTYWGFQKLCVRWIVGRRHLTWLLQYNWVFWFNHCWVLILYLMNVAHCEPAEILNVLLQQACSTAVDHVFSSIQGSDVLDRACGSLSMWCRVYSLVQNDVYWHQYPLMSLDMVAQVSGQSLIHFWWTPQPYCFE